MLSTPDAAPALPQLTPQMFMTSQNTRPEEGCSIDHGEREGRFAKKTPRRVEGRIVGDRAAEMMRGGASAARASLKGVDGESEIEDEEKCLPVVRREGRFPPYQSQP